jgi:hypothetical protein
MNDPDKVTFFAKTDARGKEISFGIKAKDRQRHMYVVGKTGMGKSTLLENMAAQDIQNGEGVAFIDPHGSAAETLLEYVPEHRVKDVVYFAPFDLDHPVSFNVMEDVGPDKRHLVVSGLMSTFKKIWVDAWSARMEYILTNALLALIEYPDTTLLSVNRLFVDKNYRKQVVEYIKDPAVKAFWTDEFANYTDRFAAEALPAIQNKIGQFTGNPLIRNIIGQPHSSFDIRKLMDEKKILIMNLSKGLIGETNANLLGSMLTTRIYLAAMSRADLAVEEMKHMPNFYFYVDEFQSFANATFANILSEARKYHLNLIIAHQYIEQMEEDVRNAVFGNVGTTVAFRVGPFDAEVLETVFAPRFEAADLVNLGFAQIYLTLMIDGIGSQPFSAQTLPPIAQPPVSCRDMVIQASRTLYAKNRDEVEKLVDELHTPKKPEDTRRQPDKRSNNNAQATGQKKNDFVPPRKPTTPTTPTTPAIERPFRQERLESPTPAKEVQKPRQEFKPKTPDDLRQVLSKMTNTVTTTNKENTPSTPAPTEVSKKPSVHTPPPRGTVDSRPERPAPQKPRAEPYQKPDTAPKTVDLKQALADVLKTVTAQQDAASEKEKSAVVQTSNPSPVHSAPAQQDKISETKPVVSQEPKVNHEPVLSPRHHAVFDDQSAPVTPTPTPTPSTSDQKLQVQPVEKREVQKNNLDASEIKRMLRQSDNERSPFN